MPTLTFRKLIRFGEDTLVVTIPAGWVRYYGLKAGDKLKVVADGELVIGPITDCKDEAEDKTNDKGEDAK